MACTTLVERRFAAKENDSTNIVAICAAITHSVLQQASTISPDITNLVLCLFLQRNVPATPTPVAEKQGLAGA
jgi:hypothetical protein